MFSKEQWLESVHEVLTSMVGELDRLSPLHLKDFDAERSVLVIMDMINGFTREGPLASPRVKALIPEISRITAACKEMGIEIIAFADAHPEDSPEFEVYPPHSIKGTSQSQIVKEIAEIGGYTLIEKQSTNGFHQPLFQQWHNENQHKDTWIIVGNCTDICVYQFATTIKTYGNTHEKLARVVVPLNGVDTYDGDLHCADLYHVVFLHSMMGNGIEVIAALT